MNNNKLVAVSVVVFLFFLFTVTGFCAGDGKVTMEQWIKIINSGDAKKSPPPKTTETKETDNKDDIDSTTPPGPQGIAVTVYWHMADDADVYLNGKPLRQYEPSFKTRPDEAPRPAFSASAVLKNGDIFTVGSRRGGSYGFMLIAVDSKGKIVFQTDQQSWKVYEPGDRADWYDPQVAIASQTQPVTVQSDPWYPQKELNAKYGNKALSIWSTPASTFAYLYGVVGGYRKTAEKTIDAAEIGKDGRFISYGNGTVMDTKTGLMWAAKDNGGGINWPNAKSYCENYRGGGYTDWRMPTQDELAGLYDPKVTGKNYGLHLTNLIDFTHAYGWASDTRGSEVAAFNFQGDGGRGWRPQSFDDGCHRALPVRSGK